MASPATLYTPLRMISQALQDAGRLAIGDQPTSAVLTDALGRLTDLINTLQTQGIKLWLNRLQSVTLVAGTSTYTLGPGGSIMDVKPLRVLEAWYVRPSGPRYPLNALSWNDYYRLGNIDAQGAVNSYFIDKQQSDLVVKFWQVPDTSAALGTVELLVQAQATTPETLTEDIAFPIEWYMALRWALADELATGQPAIIMDRCAGKAASYLEMLQNWDVEDVSSRWQPDPVLSGLRASRFR